MNRAVPPYASNKGTVMESAPAPRPAAPRRTPLRAVGVAGAIGVLLLVIVLVASALVLRDRVESHLAGIEREQAGQASTAIAQHVADARKDARSSVIAMACLASFGIMAIGALAMMFFSRLVADIGLLGTRARSIVVGDRRQGPALARNDELGDLSSALDSMADALDKHERDLEIERRHVMHQEKLATIGAMAAGVVRSIGNPIAAIDGYARGLLSRHDGSAGDVHALKDILRETDRLITTIHEISALAAPPAAQAQLANLNDIVSQSVALLRFEPRLEGVSVTRNLDPQLPALVAVADRLVLLTTSLIINAADAMAGRAQRDARIDVSTRCAGAGVELCVADNGSGMPQEVLERAFEPLFTTKPAGRGTGLGLPLARAIALEHGGDITIQSTAGQGTLVRVRLSPASV